MRETQRQASSRLQSLTITVSLYFIIIHHLCSSDADAGDATYAQPIRKKNKARKNYVSMYSNITI